MLSIHTLFQHGCNTSAEAKNKKLPRLSAQGAKTQPCPGLLASPHSPLHIHSATLHLCAGEAPPFLPSFKLEGRKHLLLEAFPDCPWPCPSIRIHTTLSLELEFPEHRFKSVPAVSPALGTLQVGALSELGGTPFPIYTPRVTTSAVEL